MRNNEERVAAVKRRVLELQAQKAARRRRIIAISGATACLLFLVGISLVMPGIMAGFSDGQTVFTGMTASIFHVDGSLGYILIALLAFALGACVTILCYRLHRLEQEEKDALKKWEDDDDRAD